MDVAGEQRGSGGVGLGVTTNIAAMSAHRSLSTSDLAMRTSLERLSSGYRINRAADDAAGLTISEGLRSQIGGSTQALRNTRDAISVVQTAEAALGEATAVLQRMRDLAVQAANSGVLSADAAAAVQTEVGQLRAELDRIAGTTTFNGTPLLDGSYHGSFQVGADVGDTLGVDIRALGAVDLGVAGIDVTDRAGLGTQSYPAQGQVPDPRTGTLVFRGATGPGGDLSSLAGTVTFQGLDLVLEDVDLSGAATTADRVALLNAAAAGVGMTHRPDPFYDDGDDLIFRGLLPSGPTDAELDDASPTFGPPSGSVSPFRAQTTSGPTAGMLLFPDTSAADFVGYRGSITANGHTLELGSVRYTDTDGSGAIDAAEVLTQLNAAAKTAGITADDHAFVETSLVVAGETVYEDLGTVLYMRGALPAVGATPAELAAATPTFVEGTDPITLIDAAIQAVSTQRAELGAVQNRFEHTVARLGASIENTTAAESRIRDTDMALETTRLARAQVLVQAGTAMLAQANQSPQGVLKLLQG